MSSRIRLVLLSFLMLFVELALIRWTGSNIIYLSYFSNFVLLGSFLGIGIGFLRARAKVNLFPWAPVALSLLVLFVHAFPVTIDRSGSGLLFFGDFNKSGLPIWATLPLIFVVVAAVMAMIAEGVARQFSKFEPLEAYRLDIIGSIGGIIAFSALSFGDAPPVMWGVIVAVLFAWLLAGEAIGTVSILQIASMLMLVGLLAAESVTPGNSWSPYYKIHLAAADPTTASDKVWVNVNGIPHQLIESTAERKASEPFYFLPYEHRTDPAPPKNVLIVGAGTGSDVAIAQSEGAGHIQAVEIDPLLQKYGVELHPDHPYQQPNVDVAITDGRAFLEQTDQKYDLILFALPDSLTLVSGQSSLRLESYLFTQEAMQSAKDHLNPGGVYAMYNYYRQPWLVDRLANTMTQVFGHPPCADNYGAQAGGLAVLADGLSQSSLNCPTTWRPSTLPVPAPATDNHPFLYLKDNKIPGFYGLTMLLILIVSLVLIRSVAGPIKPMGKYLDLFFMGAAFLLLETKNVVQFALLFGTTWFVNALVFAGILCTVLAAIEVAKRVRFKQPARLYAVLIAVLALAWLVPTDALLSLNAPLRFVAATLLAFAPVFLANLVFAERFRDVGNSTTAFGANLLGAMIGGLIEYSALVVGYRSLLIVAAILYGIAFFVGRKHLVRGGSSTADEGTSGDEPDAGTPTAESVPADA